MKKSFNDNWKPLKWNVPSETIVHQKVMCKNTQQFKQLKRALGTLKLSNKFPPKSFLKSPFEPSDNLKQFKTFIELAWYLVIKVPNQFNSTTVNQFFAKIRKTTILGFLTCQKLLSKDIYVLSSCGIQKLLEFYEFSYVTGKSNKNLPRY